MSTGPSFGLDLRESAIDRAVVRDVERHVRAPSISGGCEVAGGRPRAEREEGLDHAPADAPCGTRDERSASLEPVETHRRGWCGRDCHDEPHARTTIAPGYDCGRYQKTAPALPPALESSRDQLRPVPLRRPTRSSRAPHPASAARRRSACATRAQPCSPSIATASCSRRSTAVHSSSATSRRSTACDGGRGGRAARPAGQRRRACCCCGRSRRSTRPRSTPRSRST